MTHPRTQPEAMEGRFIEQFNGQFELGHYHGDDSLDVTSDTLEVLAFIRQELETLLDEVEHTLKLDWKPTEGYGSEEELGFQKGIMAEQKQVKAKLAALRKKTL